MQKKILILDFGSQYTQLIARRVRELEVYCEVVPYYFKEEPGNDIIGVIFSGSPRSVRDADPISPGIDWSSLDTPILGICYGAQFIAQNLGGNVSPSTSREYGLAHL
jgi:GMP synthase (glutamine-hydrolysing)